MAYIWMLFSALSFATMGALTHSLAARDNVAWETIAFVRSMVVLLSAATIVRTFQVAPHFWRPWQLWARSLSGSVSMLIVFFSLTRLPVSIVVTLLNLAPVWVTIASRFLLRQSGSRGVWMAIGIGLIGVVLIQQPQLAQNNLAVLAPLVASVLLAIVMMSLHQVKAVDSRAVVLHFALVAFVTSLGAWLWSPERTWQVFDFPGPTLLMLVATGVAATAGQLFLTIAFASGAPEKVSVVGLTQVGFAMLYDVFIWGHQFNALSLMGILLVVAPTAWLLYSERQALLVEE